MLHRVRLSPVLVAIALLLTAARLDAQEVRGELRESGSDRPIAGALVLLVDVAGQDRASALTDAAGRFHLRAPAAGTFTLRAERVGFATVESPALRLEAGATLPYRMQAAAQRAVAFDTLRVQGEGGRRSCRVRPEAGLAVAALWEEARKALNASAHVQNQQLLRYDVVLYKRDLDPRSLQVRKESREERSQVVRSPFASIGADTLLREGFIRQTVDGTEYHAPDANVLLSDAFLDGHCFSLAEDRPPQPGLVGLAFRPAGRSALADVSGVLWLDAATSELRFLEYGYTRVPVEVDSRKVGGRVEFERLPTGEWIVRRWWVRMPWVERNRVTYGLERERARTETRDSLAFLREEGGEVVSTAAHGARSLASRGSLRGVVWDSTAGAPLREARVFISGTGHAAVADSAGAFTLPGLPEGEYALSFTHPRLAATGVVPPSRSVSVRAGEDQEVALATPSPATVAARVCGGAPLAGGTGAVFGRVTREDGTAAVPGAQVTISWPRQGARAAGSVQAEADATGAFRACGVPADAELEARTAYGTQAGRAALRLDGRAALQQDLRLGGVALAAGGPDNPIPVAGVEGTADAAGRMAEARRIRGGGVLITRADIERRRPRHVVDLLRGIPNLQLVPVGVDYAVEMAGRTPPRFSSGPQPSGRIGEVTEPTEQETIDCTGAGRSGHARPNCREGGPGTVRSAKETGQCPVLFFIDGQHMPVPAGTGVGHLVQPDDVESMEVYASAAQVPARYSRGGSECGVIAIWRRGSRQ